MPLSFPPLSSESSSSSFNSSFRFFSSSYALLSVPAWISYIEPEEKLASACLIRVTIDAQLGGEVEESYA